MVCEQFKVLREKHTERAGSGEYNKSKEKGIYRCAGCDAPLFSYTQKFDSGRTLVVPSPSPLFEIPFSLRNLKSLNPTPQDVGGRHSMTTFLGLSNDSPILMGIVWRLCAPNAKAILATSSKARYWILYLGCLAFIVLIISISG